jgi:hypothetical protein
LCPFHPKQEDPPVEDVTADAALLGVGTGLALDHRFNVGSKTSLTFVKPLTASPLIE